MRSVRGPSKAGQESARIQILLLLRLRHLVVGIAAAAAVASPWHLIVPAAGSVDYAASLVCRAAGSCQILGGAAASAVVLLLLLLPWHGDVHLIVTVAAADDELLLDAVVALQMPGKKLFNPRSKILQVCM